MKLDGSVSFGGYGGATRALDRGCGAAEAADDGE
jgi:hypothetical protein